MFALPLVLTTNCSVGEALSSCFSMMKKYWLPVIACYIIMLVLILISEFLLIVWIWTAPMFFVMFGVFFRDAYGLQNQRNVPVVPVKRSPLGE
jgi:hypothetical protein